jgi:aspartate aminotransferase
LISNPTWPNHHQIFSQCGFKVETYPYYCPASKGLDITAMLDTLKNAPRASIVILQTCAHNPTGIDPTQEEWKQIATVMRNRGHFPFFDCAYQGFASGDLSRDAWACRYFVEQGLECCIAQSFAKNLGLYGERVGAFHLIAAPGNDASAICSRVATQLAILQRAQISNPPVYGARIASCVLNDEELFSQWQGELRVMSSRLSGIRETVRAQLQARGTPGSWDFLVAQIGMFSYTGLTRPQILHLKDKWHIYMVSLPRSEYVDFV